MVNTTLRELEGNVHEIESKIISNRDNLKTLVPQLCVAIGRYKSKGGKKRLLETSLRNILFKVITKMQDRENLIHKTIMDVEACNMMFRLMDASQAILRRPNGMSLSLSEVLSYVKKREPELFETYRLQFKCTSDKEVDWAISKCNDTIHKSYFAYGLTLLGAMYFDLVKVCLNMGIDKEVSDIIIGEYF